MHDCCLSFYCFNHANYNTKVCMHQNSKYLRSKHSYPSLSSSAFNYFQLIKRKFVKCTLRQSSSRKKVYFNCELLINVYHVHWQIVNFLNIGHDAANFKCNKTCIWKAYVAGIMYLIKGRHFLFHENTII